MHKSTIAIDRRHDRIRSADPVPSFNSVTLMLPVFVLLLTERFTDITDLLTPVQ
jgi:hypothetical protein